MPYSVSNPPARIKGLPKHAQEIWISAYNSAWETYDPEKARAEGREAYANSVAWGAVNKKYVKKGERWVAKEAREVAIPGRILMPPHGQLIQQHKKKAILSVTKDEEHIKVPIYIIQGDKIWAEVVLAPPVAITVADFRKSRAEHRVSDAEMRRWGWRGQQLYLYYFQSVETYDPPLEIEQPPEDAQRWVEGVMLKEEALREGFAQELSEEARHRRDHCMRCDAKPTKQVLWAEGKAMAWFCEKCLGEWHAEGEGWHAVDKLITVDDEALSTEEFKKVPDELKEDDPLKEALPTGMPKHAKEIWDVAYKAAYDRYDPETHEKYDKSLSRERNREVYAHSVAWAAVKEKYEKVGEKWQVKEAVHPHGPHICYCPECGYEQESPAGVKCREQSCPKCNSPLRAREAGEYRQEVIRKIGSKWVLFTRDGKKRLGEFDTKEGALKRERQIQFFKHLRGVLVPDELHKLLESLTEGVYQQGRGEGKMEALWALQDALPPESQITLASGFDTGLRILLDYIERLKAGAEERKTS